MRRTIIALVLSALCANAFAQEQQITVSGLAKSGIYWEEVKQNGMDPVPKVSLKNKDGDAGDGVGRFQLDADYARENMGIKTRIRWDQWGGDPKWTYGFAYGNFFDDQLTFAVGKLGSSPWGTGGPEMWKELEISASSGGMRTEIKPKIIPGLNIGFVFNGFNQALDGGFKEEDVTFLALLQESVVGVSYTNEHVHARFAYRFDSDMDAQVREVGLPEDELLYRVEARAIGKLVEGAQLWAMGYFQYVSANDPDFSYMRNWLFAQYDPPKIGNLDKPFTAQVRVGYDWIPNRSVLSVKPSFFWNFFNNLLNVGAAFSFAQDFGAKKWEGSPYSYIELEPKIQINFGGSYVAFAYNWRREYVGDYESRGDLEPIRQTQWINLRFCMQM